MGELEGNIDCLESQRRKLEENVEKLRKSLQHWQTWEAEYEGFKEELLGMEEEVTNQQLEIAGKDFDGVLLNDKEIKDLFRGGHQGTRSSHQAFGLLSRRIDYVQDNIKTVKRQLDLANENLLAATVLVQPEVQNDEGLALIEIVEELDDDDNIISGSITTPNDSTRQLADALREVGVEADSQQNSEKNAAEQDHRALESSTEPRPTETVQVKSTNTISNNSEASERRETCSPNNSQVAEAAKKSKPIRKKSVTFSEDTKYSGSTSNQPSMLAERQARIKSNERIEQDRSTVNSVKLKDIKNEVDDDHSEPPVIPTTDSPEDAVLRRQMLQYGMNEVGAIVAEMDLDDPGTYTDEESDDQYDSSLDEEGEERSGRTSRNIIDEVYRKEMLELEQKLNAKMLQNVGPEPYKWVQKDQVRAQQSKAGSRQQDSNEAPRIVKEKAVRFAEELDVSNAQSIKKVKPKSIIKDDLVNRPIGDFMVEQSTSNDTINVLPNASKKPPRFKMARAERQQASSVNKTDRSASNTQPSSYLANLSEQIPQTQDNISSNPPPRSNPFPSSATFSLNDRIRRVPEGPAGQIQSSTLVERPRNSDPIEAAVEPDELDPGLLHQEVALQYHRMHNRIIQRKGGFTQKDEEEGEDEDAILEDERGRKMSMFKAARLARVGR